MSERKTISDSKRGFHRAFPHVIPAIYRRVADELLVELHLLSHQKDFKVDGLFAVGLCKVFDELTLGYKPENHLIELFSALCESTGFDSKSLRSKSETILTLAKNSNSEDIENYLAGDNETNESLTKEIGITSLSKKFYTRLSAIGLMNLLLETEEEGELDRNACNKKALKILSSQGFSGTRIEKDLALYNNSLEKLSIAIDLIKESAISNRKKREAKNNIENKDDTTQDKIAYEECTIENNT